jgi:hypothetical protein
MPPQLHDGETREQAILRWMTRILAALAHQSKTGTIIVSRRSLDAVSDTVERQALFEDRDKRGNLVLRFGSKHSAVYPVESDSGKPDGKWEGPKEVRIDRSQPQVQSQLSPSPSEPQVVPPKSSAREAQLEITLKRQQLANKIVAGALQRERQKRQSLEGMLEGLPEVNERGAR